jgi:uncharacterized protein (TIGR03435 family)
MIKEARMAFTARVYVAAVPGLMMAWAACGWAQSQPARPEFAVASIKVSPRCMAGIGLNRSTPGTPFLPCVSLRGLVLIAYGRLEGGPFPARFPEILGGPDWTLLEHFEVMAKADSQAHIAQMAGPMLQALLAERFKLKVHREPREKPVYLLTLPGAQHKLTRSPEGSCAPFDFDALNSAQGAQEQDGLRPFPSLKVSNFGPQKPMTASCHGVTMAEFASMVLGMFADRPVIDKTGLDGRFDIHLEATEIRGEVPAPALLAANSIRPSESASEPDGAGPSLFQALQKQLGLKLAPGRAPVDVIVIDHVERPSAN